jgi:hypothetical protein
VTFGSNFSIRDVNVIKINAIVDAEIMLKECDFALSRMDEQKLSPVLSSDPDWVESAARARVEIEHKRALIFLKLEALQARVSASKPSESSFVNRFHRAAEAILSPDLYAEIKALANTPLGAP